MQSETPTKPTTDGDVFVLVAGTVQTLENVADIAEVGSDRLRVAFLDGTTTMIAGSIFGANGDWKTWLDTPAAGIENDVADSPMTLPNGNVSVRSGERSGRIKRLKRASL